MFTLFSPHKWAVFGCLLLFGPVFEAHAEVLDAQPQGFAIRIDTPIMATPAEVYAVMAEQVGAWWHPAHTFSGDAENLSIEAHAGGCFCEQLPGGGSVRHMEVVFVAPGKLLRMQGGLGPLQNLGVSGSLSWHLHQEESGTRLEILYNVGGFLSDGLDAWAKPVESVLADQAMRLKNLVETGTPDAFDPDAENDDA